MLTPEEEIEEIVQAEMDALKQRVIDLWDREGGWIPGCSREQLAEALGVEPMELRTAQQLRAASVAPGYLEV